MEECTKDRNLEECTGDREGSKEDRNEGDGRIGTWRNGKGDMKE